MHKTKTVPIIGFDHRFDAWKKQIITPVQILPAHNDGDVVEPYPGDFNALWDTGATASTISTSLAGRLRLPAITEREIRGVNGSYTARGFLAALHLPNKVTIKEIVLYEFAGAPKFDMLIGMDIISLGDFMVSTYEGKTHVSFQMPSTGHKTFYGARYVKGQAQNVVDGQEKRRGPCPCGSGKKYKNCCEKKRK